MKNSVLHGDSELEVRNQRLNRAIIQLYYEQNRINDNQCDVGLQDRVSCLPIAAKEKIYFDDNERKQEDAYWNTLQDFLLEQRRFLDAGFPQFLELPQELRLIIWTHAMEDHLKPRTHIISKKNGQFISNQDISVLLSICSESRTAYLRAGNEFAFGTYLNFDIDIIYIRDFPDATGYGPRYSKVKGVRNQDYYALDVDIWEKVYRENSMGVNLEEDTGGSWRKIEAYRVAAEGTFQRFLDHESTGRIKRLAMTDTFFACIPISEVPWMINYTMVKKMRLLEEAFIVLEDTRLQDAAWSKKNITLFELTLDQCRQKGLKPGKMISRLQRMTLPRHVALEFDEQAKWKFVEVQEEVEDISQGCKTEKEVCLLIEKMREASLDSRRK
jgi:hypothetical protein